MRPGVSGTSEPGLLRLLGLGASTMLVVSSVIGSGVYKKMAPMAAELGSPLLILLCWVLAGVITLFGALSNAEVAGMFADAGGEYVYYKRIYGRFIAFLYGWSNFSVIKSAAVASITYVFAQSFNSVLPLPRCHPALEEMNILGIFRPLDNLGVKLVAVVTIGALTLINSRGLKNGTQVSSWMTKLMITGLAMVVFSGLFFGGGSLDKLSSQAAVHTHSGQDSFAVIKAFFAALLAAFWAYEGWNVVGFLGGEIKSPNKTIPLALLTGTGIVIAVYVLVNFTYLYVLPVDHFAVMSHSANDIAAVSVLKHIAGNPGALALSLLIFLTTLGCSNTTILAPPRVYYAMAKDGLFFKSAAVTHSRSHTPNTALWLQAVWSSLLVVSGSFDQLTDMLIFAAFFYYGATTLGVFILRVRAPHLKRPYRAWGYPVIPAIFLLFCCSLILITFFARPREAGLGVLLILTGIPFYYYWNSKAVTSARPVLSEHGSASAHDRHTKGRY